MFRFAQNLQQITLQFYAFFIQLPPVSASAAGPVPAGNDGGVRTDDGDEPTTRDVVSADVRSTDGSIHAIVSVRAFWTSESDKSTLGGNCLILLVLI